MITAIRLGLGFLLAYSGFIKISEPYQNFLFVIETYEILPIQFAEIFARAFPWIEFWTGVLLIVGWWLRLALYSAFFMFVSFIIVIAQALIRKLPVEECGCFGEALSLPPMAMLGLDSLALVFILFISLNYRRAHRWSLEHFLGR